ncbi:MAG TPA: glutaredoxin family protein [Candidatus Eisenbacteria bacterium]|nr:glutaredoxin family protein [Candidatus Eisenbacteria bacterium]
MVAPLPDLVLYVRPGCSLCDEAREAIGLVIADRRARGASVPAVVERNIEADEALHRAYLERIPVVELGEHRLELLVTVGKLRRLLADVLDEDPVSPTRWPAGNRRPGSPVERA